MIVCIQTCPERGAMTDIGSVSIYPVGHSHDLSSRAAQMRFTCSYHKYGPILPYDTKFMASRYRAVSRPYHGGHKTHAPIKNLHVTGNA